MKRKEFGSVEDIITMAKSRGSHWFDPDTMRFFRSRAGDTVYKGVYFVTSEQFDDNSPRLYTIRKVHCTKRLFEIRTIGDFQGYKTRGAAVYHIMNYLK